ncbi:MAG: Hsp20/alpha crystallin family protein [Methylococcales bacterium]|nr:Hsp20/alpha crystallin family protein [Methylococcales bacterium]
MKNSVIIIIGALLLFAFGMQVYMFYQIHEKLEQRFSLEKTLDLSSGQGSDSWVQASNNWNPYEELFRMRNEMERLFNDTASRFHQNSNAGSLTRMPAINVKDEQDRYVVTADVPGADESSLNVALNGRQLTISIKTGSESDQTADNNKYQRRERFNGEFRRDLTLPGDVDKNAMKTEYKNGVLTIMLPKA